MLLEQRLRRQPAGFMAQFEQSQTGPSICLQHDGLGAKTGRDGVDLKPREPARQQGHALFPDQRQI